MLLSSQNSEGNGLGDSCQERSKDDDRAGLWVFLSFGIRSFLKPYSISSPHPWPLKTRFLSPVIGRRSPHTRSHLPQMPETEVSVPHIRIPGPRPPWERKAVVPPLFWYAWYPKPSLPGQVQTWLLVLKLKASSEISPSCKLQFLNLCRLQTVSPCPRHDVRSRSCSTR